MSSSSSNDAQNAVRNLQEQQPGAASPSTMSNSFWRPSSRASFQRIRNSLSNVIRETERYVVTARNVQTTFMNRSEIESTARAATPGASHSSHIVIEVGGDVVPAASAPPPTEPPLPPPMAPPLPPALHNNNQEEAPTTQITTDADELVVRAREDLKPMLKYLPFMMILFAKMLYDYQMNILILLVLFIVTVSSSKAVQEEAAKREARSKRNLLSALGLMHLSLHGINFLLNSYVDLNVVFNVILMRSFLQPKSLSNLLWMVVIVDYVLKIITITVKILLTLLPEMVCQFNKRGRIYCFIEALSQTYRSIVTIQPWLYYLLESYQGPEKIISGLLSALYIIFKGTYLMGKLKVLKTASVKMLQNLAVGTAPSRDDLKTAGEHCTICYDEYTKPVLLTCRHIFCESCVSVWFDREKTCPLCRAKIVEDVSWRDGATSYFIQLF